MTGGEEAETSTEWVNLIAATPGPDLPWRFSYHCIAKMSSGDDKVIMIGGLDDPKKTSIFDVKTNSFTTGPELWQNCGRLMHACAHIRHKNGSNYVIAASGYTIESHFTSEILNADDLSSGWSPGEDF